MQGKPNKWTGAFLSLIGFKLGLGLFYVGAPWLALVSIAVFLGAGCLMFIAASQWQGAFLLFIAALVVATVLLTYTLASRGHASTVRGWSARWYGLLGVALIYFLATQIFRSFLYEPFRVPSTAMAPGLIPGSLIVVQKWGYGHYRVFGSPLFQRPRLAPLVRGDIIVFDSPLDPSQTYIRRLVGLSQDTVVIENRQLTVNGVPVVRKALEDYLMLDELRYAKRFEEVLDGAKYGVLHEDNVIAFSYRKSALPKAHCTIDSTRLMCSVPRDHYFVLGDNRDSNLDSRMFGYITGEQIIGKVVWQSQQRTGRL